MPDMAEDMTEEPSGWFSETVGYEGTGTAVFTSPKGYARGALAASFRGDGSSEIILERPEIIADLDQVRNTFEFLHGTQIAADPNGVSMPKRSSSGFNTCSELEVVIPTGRLVSRGSVDFGFTYPLAEGVPRIDSAIGASSGSAGSSPSPTPPTISCACEP